MQTWSVRLGPGGRWRLAATADAQSWLARFAAILELEPDDGEPCPRILFHRDAAARADLLTANNLPAEGWTRRSQLYTDLWRNEVCADVLCDLGRTGTLEEEVRKMQFGLEPIYQAAHLGGGLPIHGGLAVRNGRGFIVAGPDSAGKSTTCRRMPAGWEVLADDDTLVVRDRPGRYRAHPFPTWSSFYFEPKRCERTWNVRRSVPLAAMFFLEKSGTNEVRPLGSGVVAMLVARSVSYPHRVGPHDESAAERRERHRLRFDTSCQIAAAVPGYLLRTTLEGRFWEGIDRVLRAGAEGGTHATG